MKMIVALVQEYLVARETYQFRSSRRHIPRRSAEMTESFAIKPLTIAAKLPILFVVVLHMILRTVIYPICYQCTLSLPSENIRKPYWQK